MPKKSDSTSSGRNHVERSPTAPVLAGSLGHELQGHANERAQHFFYFVVTMKLVIAELNAIGGEGTPWQSSRFVSIKATEQIGSGLRGDAVEYNDFVKTNGGVVDQPTTHFADRDAAHFCNLGLKAGFDAGCGAGWPGRS
ncbi:MAG: hypothetical protein Q8L92_15330, partial [Rubrivivax sp.]|nr:hypothetical protein [Rubrivivax sp.]